MGSSQKALKTTPDRIGPRAPPMALTENGLVLGATVLASIRDVDGAPEIVIDGAEEPILALLATAYGRAVGPAVLRNIRLASNYWSQGGTVLAEIELALAGLQPFDDVEAASLRLSLAERLLADGVTPRELIKACGLDLAPLDLVKAYNPDQPHVPAGNPDGGQWIGDNATGAGAGYGSSMPPRGEPTRRPEQYWPTTGS